MTAPNGRLRRVPGFAVKEPEARNILSISLAGGLNTVWVIVSCSFEREISVPLHGFPWSSYQFDDLIPLLADQFASSRRAIPARDTARRPTFDSVAMAIDAFIVQCAPAGPLILYMDDIGGPIGMRIATAHPERIAGLIVQNMTTSVEGWNPERLKVYERLSGPETPENLAQTGKLVTVERDMFLHKRGARRPEA